MNWIISSLLLFLSSNVLYLLIRKYQKEKLSNNLLNLGMFFVPGIFYLIAAIIFNYSLQISLNILLIILSTAFFFSYLGNLFSLKAISLSPNPGYSLIISKSYVVFTTIVAVIVFDSEINGKSILAIILIVSFSVLIFLEKSKSKISHKSWLIYSLGAFLGWGMLALVSKYILSSGLNVFAYLFYLSFFVSGFIFIENKVIENKFSFDTKYLVPILLIGISSSLFNFFMQYGYVVAPNLGYINAVNASSISLLTLLSAYFFKDELTVRKIIGVIGVTAGLIILLI